MRKYVKFVNVVIIITRVRALRARENKTKQKEMMHKPRCIGITKMHKMLECCDQYNKDLCASCP